MLPMRLQVEIEGPQTKGVPALQGKAGLEKEAKVFGSMKPFKVPERPVSLYCVRGHDHKERLIKEARACPEPMGHEVCKRCAINLHRKKFYNFAFW